jgi:tetratricopeptide (TPR) repeat protein
MKNSIKSESDMLVNFDPSADPPDALHRVFERLAHSYFTQQNYDKAQVLYERILVHRLNHFGPGDTILVVDLTNLAGVLIAQEKFEQAEPFVRRAVTILESSSVLDPVKIAETLSILGNVYTKQDKLKEAEPIYKRALALRKERLEPGHADIAQSLSDYARLLRRLKRDDEAEVMYQEAIGMMGNLATSTGQFTALKVPHELTENLGDELLEDDSEDE